MIKIILITLCALAFVQPKTKTYQIKAIKVIHKNLIFNGGSFNFLEKIEANKDKEKIEWKLYQDDQNGINFFELYKGQKLIKVLKINLKNDTINRPDAFEKVNDTIYFLKKINSSLSSMNAFPEGFGNHTIMFIPSKQEIKLFYSGLEQDSLVAILRWK